jgi:hypothetical protein
MKKTTLVLLLVLAGCTSTQPAGPIDYGRYALSYKYACKSLPSPPFCVSNTLLSGTGDGFQDNWSFQVCRVSVSNFISALETHYECKARSAEETFSEVIETANLTRDCYANYLAQADHSKKQLITCPAIKIPSESVRKLEVDYYDPDINRASNVSLEHNLGLPYCATREISGDSFIYSMEDCLPEIDAYLGVGTLIQSMPEQLYEKYLNDLRRSMDTYGEEVKGLFNCRANREAFCFF